MAWPRRREALGETEGDADGRDPAGAFGMAIVVVGVGLSADGVGLAEAVVVAAGAGAGVVVFEAWAEAEASTAGAGLADTLGPALPTDTGSACRAELSFTATFLTFLSDELFDAFGDAALDAAALGKSIAGAIGLPPAKEIPRTVMYTTQPSPTKIPIRRTVRARPPDESTKIGIPRAGRLR
jgi:hypothetical protein